MRGVETDIALLSTLYWWKHVIGVSIVLMAALHWCEHWPKTQLKRAIAHTKHTKKVSGNAHQAKTMHVQSSPNARICSYLKSLSLPAAKRLGARTQGRKKANEHQERKLLLSVFIKIHPLGSFNHPVQFSFWFTLNGPGEIF